MKNLSSNEKKHPARILIMDFNSWVGHPDKTTEFCKNHVKLVYTNGYINYFQYNKELENFLISHSIEHKIHFDIY